MNVLAIPFYFCTHPQRRLVTHKVFAHYAKIAADLGLATIGVGSEGDVSRDVWSEYFADGYIEHPQTFTAGVGGSEGLRAKFDATVQAAQRFGPERVFIGGSDDILPPEFFAHAFASDADVVGITGGCRIVHDKQIYEWDGCYDWAPEVTLCGGGLVLSRRLLDRWGWAPFSEQGDEMAIERRARGDGFTIEGVECGFWSVKTTGAVLNDCPPGLPMASPETHATFDALWAAL